MSSEDIPLPRGTRVLLRVDIPGAEGFVHRRASIAIVREVQGHTYSLKTPSGRALSAQRDQIRVQREDVLEKLAVSRFDYERLQSGIIFASVVGSQAWGLAGPDSDEDVRGAFVLPFSVHTGLWKAPADIKHPDSDAAYWEAEKLVQQGLRGDANTLEALWSPIKRDIKPIGQRLIDDRRMFASMNVLGSFGRYAQSQFVKIERSLLRAQGLQSLLQASQDGRVTDRDTAIEHLGRDLGVTDARGELKSILRSLCDRALLPNATFEAYWSVIEEGSAADLEPAPARPKNAYNLLRLLHSCLSWLRQGEPLIEVQDPLRATLLDIKEKRLPLEKTLMLAKETAAEVDEAAKAAKLPESPDFAAADAWLRAAREEEARRFFGTQETSSVVRNFLPDELPEDVQREPLQEFLQEYSDDRVLWVALTGAHAYGFASPDSDLDLKGVRVATAAELLGTKAIEPGKDIILDYKGREYDYTANDLATVATLILKGNGNMLERLLGPFQVLTSELGASLQDLATKNLSARCQHHYRGFFGGMQREYATEKARGERRAKRLLYAYRVALTGQHLLRTGSLQTDVRPLSEAYNFPRVTELLDVKKSAEKAQIQGDDAAYLEDFVRLEKLMEEAVENTVLPEHPKAAGELELFVIETRKRRLR